MLAEISYRILLPEKARTGLAEPSSSAVTVTACVDEGQEVAPHADTPSLSAAAMAAVPPTAGSPAATSSSCATAAATAETLVGHGVDVRCAFIVHVNIRLDPLVSSSSVAGETYAATALDFDTKKLRRDFCLSVSLAPNSRMFPLGRPLERCVA